MAPLASAPSAPPQISPAPPVLDQGIIPLPQTMSVDDEPPSKKLRSEDNLISETEFIAMHKVYKVKFFDDYIFNIGSFHRVQ